MTSDADVQALDLEGLDPFAPAFRASPWALYRRLQDERPVHRTPQGSWVLTRWDDCSSVLRDPTSSVSDDNLDRSSLDRVRPPAAESGFPVLLFMDPPDHTRLRRLVAGAFTPKVVNGLRPRVQQVVDDLLDAVAPSGRIEVIRDLAYPLPVIVICELLGVPTADQDRFGGWSGDASRLLDGDLPPDVMERGSMAAMELAAYFNDLVGRRRSDPGDDLLSALIHATDEGEQLTHEELIATTILLFIAGHETTMNLIGNGLRALLQHPDQLALVRDDPSVARSAVEELLRFDGPVHLTGRITTRPLEVRGVEIPKGHSVVTLLAAANRDPSTFADPERLDVTRSPNPQLTFSAGAHFCLGAALARVEGEIAIPSLLRRLPDVRLEGDEPSYRDHFILRGLDDLPLTFTPG